jgi:hypothetical protein
VGNIRRSLSPFPFFFTSFWPAGLEGDGGVLRLMRQLRPSGVLGGSMTGSPDPRFIGEPSCPFVLAINTKGLLGELRGPVFRGVELGACAPMMS